MKVTAEVLAAFELERVLHRAAATRFERTASGFACANPDLVAVWDASRAQIEPDLATPDLETLRELTEMPARWHPGLRHRQAFIAHNDGGRELAFALAREGWEVTELALLICRVPPQASAAARRLEGPARQRLKGRLGVEQGLPPEAAAQFDRYDELRARAAARITFGGFEGSTALALADMYLRGDIAVIEDVATLGRARHRGLGSAAVRGATAAALRLSARAVYLFATPEVGELFYEPLGFERIGGAWECRKAVTSGG